MSAMLKGHVENNIVFLDTDVHLPNGTKVLVTIVDDDSSTSGLCGIWKDSRTADEIVRDIYESRTKGREERQ